MKVLIVDDHKLMRDGLRAILERDGIEVVGEADNGHDVLSAVSELHPQIVIMDVAMRGLNGVDATRKLVSTVPGVKVIGLSLYSDRRYVIAMFEAGAVGYLLKSSGAEELLQAIGAVSRDLTYVSPAVAGYVVDACLTPGMAAKPARHLTPREREVLQLLAEGKTSKEIATQLDCAVPTIETHRRQIMEKLGLHTVAELTKYAIREGLTSVE